MSQMSRRFILTCILALLMIATVTGALAVPGTVSSSSVVLREEMTTGSEAVITLRKGDEVDVISKQGSWYKVKNGSKTGYVMTRYIKVSGEVPEANATETLREGMRGDNVKKMQERLKDLGYLNGKCDGDFGEMTRDAVVAFQKRNSLTADGVAGKSTLTKLYSSSAKKAATTSSNKEDSGVTLRPGMTGVAVKELQTRLRELGYFNHSLDSRYDDQLKEGVMAFQKAHGLTVDGIAGPATIAKVFSSSAKKADGSSSDKEEDGVTLRPGMTGVAVKEMQTRLRALGYFDHALDGKYDNQLKEGVMAFQKANGLTADGIAGPKTIEKLFSNSAKPAPGTDKEDDKSDGSASGTLRPGMTGDEVKELQTRLRALGYFDHALDGKYDNQLKEGVMAFQKAHGLTADGIAGAKTLEKLFGSSAKPAPGTDKEDDKTEGSTASGTLRPGMTGTKVKELQTRLRALGYFNHALDAKYDDQLKEGVMAFQKAHGLTADGIAGAKTLEKLFSSSAKPADGSSKDEDSDESDSTTTLRPGMTGEAVKELQTRLRELGYFDHSLDGKYDYQVVEGVKAFQKRHGLTQDGIAGAVTLNKLFSNSAKPAEGKEVEEEESLTINTSESMKIGDRSDNVKAMQQRLKKLGYFSGTCTGYYGTATRDAVKDFQRNNNLSVDGLAGTATLRKLVSSSAKGDGTSSGTTESTTLRPGSTGAAVTALQTRLRALGYYDHSVDGKYDNYVTEAVKAFQKRNGLTADGLAGTLTIAKLNSSSAKPAEGSSSSGSTSTDKDDETLRLGMTGTKVKELQTRLRALGYFNHALDGKYDYQVVEGVKAFQKRNGLTVDGIAGKTTQNKLFSSSAKPAEDEDDNDSSGGSSGGSSSDETLRLGDTGTKVKELQTRLRELGYFNHALDGKYDNQVVEAVKAFQKRHGLTQDGIAGKATQNKLFSSSAKPAEDEDDGDSSSGSSGGSTSTETLRPGMTGTKVKELQTRLRELGYFNHSLDGKYDSQVTEAVKAFQKRNGLTQDGIAGKVTQNKLFSSSAKPAEDEDDDSSSSSGGTSSGTYKTERLDWFNGGASRIPRGAIFSIKDVATGKVFRAKRQAGANHLDAEPLTAADTAVLKSINNFSWRRRPMLVLYNGRVYACSIYAEPHGSDTIPDNNYEGQFCLHFYGSMTHGTKVVDPDHAACEAKAMKATW